MLRKCKLHVHVLFYNLHFRMVTVTSSLPWGNTHIFLSHPAKGWDKENIVNVAILSRQIKRLISMTTVFSLLFDVRRQPHFKINDAAEKEIINFTELICYVVLCFCRLLKRCNNTQAHGSHGILDYTNKTCTYGMIMKDNVFDYTVE